MFSGARGSGKSRVLRVGVAKYLNQLAQQQLKKLFPLEFVVVVFDSWQGEPLADLKEQVRADIKSILEKRHFDILQKLLLCCSFSEETSLILWFSYILDQIYQRYQTQVRRKINSVPLSLTLTESIQEWTEIFGRKLLIVLDQFEQYFQHQQQEDKEGAFVTELSNALSHNDLDVNFLISLRENTLSKLCGLKKHIPAIFDNHLHLKQLDDKSTRTDFLQRVEEYNLQLVLIDNLLNSRLTLLSGAIGVGKSSVLKTAKQNIAQSGIPKFVVVCLSAWQNDPLAELKNELETEIKNIVPDVQVPQLGLSLTETLQAWTEILGKEQEVGKISIILDQFEQYFQYHPQEDKEITFLTQLSDALSRNDLAVNFLISIREDALFKLCRLKEQIPGIFDNHLHIKHLDQKSAIADLVKPTDKYNLQQIISNNVMKSRLTLLSESGDRGESPIVRANIAQHLDRLVTQNLKELRTPKFASVVFDAWKVEPLAGLKQQILAGIKSLLVKNQFDIRREAMLCYLYSQTVFRILWSIYIYQILVIKALDSSVDSSIKLVDILQVWTESLGQAQERLQEEQEDEKKVVGKLVVILDQFEKYFQYHPQEDGDSAFLTELSDALNCPNLAVNFLISISDSALSKLDDFHELIPSLFDNHLRIKHLEKQSAIADFVKPIEGDKYQEVLSQKSFDVEEALIEKVLDKVKTDQIIWGQNGRGGSSESSKTEPEQLTKKSDKPIETPYLQLVITRLWEEEMSAGLHGCNYK